MARKITHQSSDEDEIEVFSSYDDKPTSTEKTDHQQAMDGLIESLGNIDNVNHVDLYRSKEKTKQLDYLDSFPPDNYDTLAALHAYIRDEWGAGEYRLMARVNGKLILNRPILVSLPKSKTSATYVSGSQKEPQNNQLVMEVLQRMDKMQEQMMLLAAKQSQQPQAQPQLDRSSFLQELVTYKQLFSGNDSGKQQTTTTEFIEMFKLAKELSNGGDVSSPDFWSAVTPAISKLAEKVVDEPKVSKPQPQPQQLMQRQPPQQQLNPLQQRVAAARNILSLAVNADDDTLPAYAHILASQYYEYVPMLEKETWLSDLSRIFPEALNNSVKMGKLRELVLNGDQDDEIEENENDDAEQTEWDFRNQENGKPDENLEGTIQKKS